jgi:hypothetical protein
MKDQIAKLVSRTKAFESRLAATVEGAARRIAGGVARQPIEVVTAIADDVAREIQPAGRGRVGFPFNQVRLSFAAPEAAAQARLDAICEGPPSLRDRIVLRLQSAGCAVVDLDVVVSYQPAPGPDWARPEYHVDLLRVREPPRPAPITEAALELTITQGSAERAAYTLTGASLSIGRGAEVRDSRLRLVRVNDVAFVEGAAGVNQTVSRCHARIERDVSPGRFRVFDEGSAQGTSILRGGKTMAVPGGSRGSSLRDGDEIALGEARLRVKIAASVLKPST